VFGWKFEEFCLLEINSTNSWELICLIMALQVRLKKKILGLLKRQHWSLSPMVPSSLRPFTRASRWVERI
jgi:hypothetical protein